MSWWWGLVIIIAALALARVVAPKGPDTRTDAEKFMDDQI